MTAVLFRTPGELPLDAFTTFGVNAKPNTKSPFGYFGTGLKYAVAVILRHGGSFRVFIKGVEYEFYLHDKEFRGKDFKQVRMRKRKWGMTRWLKSIALPFTTELGKNWELWQAYRELESNTRDENGESTVLEKENALGEYEGFEFDPSGTDIVIECDGFAENAGQVFLPPVGERRAVFDCAFFTAYEGQSDYLYYQGIRVYTLKNPSKITYDFKPGRITLTEDRTIKDAWSVQYDIARQLQYIQDRGLIRQLLTKNKDEHWFETDDITFYTNEVPHFFQMAHAIAASHQQGGFVARSVRAFVGSNPIPEPVAPSTKTEIELENDTWINIYWALRDDGKYQLAQEIWNALPENVRSAQDVYKTTEDDVPF